MKKQYDISDNFSARIYTKEPLDEGGFYINSVDPVCEIEELEDKIIVTNHAHSYQFFRKDFVKFEVVKYSDKLPSRHNIEE